MCLIMFDKLILQICTLRFGRRAAVGNFTVLPVILVLYIPGWIWGCMLIKICVEFVHVLVTSLRSYCLIRYLTVIFLYF